MFMKNFFKDNYNFNITKFEVKPQEDMLSLTRLMEKNQMKTILDHGCGGGRNTIYLAKQGFIQSRLCDR